MMRNFEEENENINVVKITAEIYWIKKTIILLNVKPGVCDLL